MQGGEKRKSNQPAAPWAARVWDQMLRGGSAGWLISTILQAMLTWLFLLIAKVSEGLPWEAQTKALVIVAIAATWGMALRCIRARLLELVRGWKRLSQGLLRQARERGAGEELPEALKALRDDYVLASMLRLRIIAAGLTLPLFCLTVFTAALCFAMCWHRGDTVFLSLGIFMSAIAVIVSTYLHWACLPAPAATGHRTRLHRMRRMKE